MVDPFNVASRLTIVSEADENLPAIVTIHSDSEFVDEAGKPYPNQPIDQTTDMHGPWVICFSAPEVIDAINADSFLASLLMEGASVRPVPTRQIVNYALGESASVIIDPFMEDGRIVSFDDLRKAY